MNVVFDTNVVLDAILDRNDFRPAQELVMAVANEKITGIVTANSLTDIYYVARKLLGEQDVRRAISNVLSVFDIATVDGEVCSDALNVPMKDYEDAIVVVCAAREEADCIATSDKGFLEVESPIPVKQPKEVLDLIE